MSSVISRRRHSDPTPAEIEARKAEIRAGILTEAAELYRQRDERKARQQRRKAPEPVEPKPMSKADICNVDIGSLFELNRGLDGFDLGQRYSVVEYRG